MKKLGQLLLDFGWIEDAQLRQALQTQDVMGGRIGSCLLEVGALDEAMLLRALAHQRSVPAARASDLINVPEEVTSLLPKRLALRCQAVPFRMLGSELYIALLDVDNLDRHDEIAFATGKQVRIHIANEARLFGALHRYYGREMAERFHQLEVLLDRPDAAFRRRSGFGQHLGPESDGAGGGGSTVLRHPLAGGVAPPGPAAITSPFLRRFDDLDEFTEAIYGLQDREDMARLFVEHLRRYYRRLLLFKVLPDRVAGWSSAGAGIDGRRLEEFEADLSQPSIFQDLRKGRHAHAGPLANSLQAHRRLFDVLGEEESPDLVTAPVRVGSRLVSVLVGEPDPEQDRDTVVRETTEACNVLGNALANYLLRQRASSG